MAFYTSTQCPKLFVLLKRARTTTQKVWHGFCLLFIIINIYLFYVIFYSTDRDKNQPKIMKDFIKHVAAIIGLLLLIMASVFSVVTGFQYNALMGIASLVLIVASVPVWYALVQYLLNK